MIEKYRNKNILITGANGFSGTWLSTYLYMMGANVYGFGLEGCHTEEFYSAKTSDIFVQFDYVDIINSQELIEKYSYLDFDYIFHLAAQPLVLHAYDDPGATMHTNVIGTINLIDFIIQSQQKSKNLFVTTDKVYFNSNKSKPFSETDVLWGNEPYASSKVAMEAVLEGFFQANKALKERSVIVRAGNIFGGGDFSQNRLIVDYFRAKNSSMNLAIRRPHAVRPWQHIIEVVEAYCKLLSNHLCLGSVYNVGPNISNCINVLNLIQLFNMYDDNCVDILFEKETTAYESGTLSLNNDKIISEEIWCPHMSLNYSIKLTSKWYENYQVLGGLDIIKSQLSEVLGV